MPEASPRGTYLVIADRLRKGVEAGKFADGLPSEAELGVTHGVARNTIRRALQALEAEGVIETAPGVGRRVARGGDKRTLVERMTAIIEEDSLAVGDGYPSEAKLCARFGASRTAVRRGLAQMEGSGLLDTVHGKGRTVRALPAPTDRP